MATAYHDASFGGYARRRAEPIVWEDAEAWRTRDTHSHSWLSDVPIPTIISPGSGGPLRWRQEVQVPTRRQRWTPDVAFYDHLGVSFLHAWIFKDIERWLYAEGLEDTVAAFRSTKLTGEDLIRMTPDNAATTLALSDSATVMRICAALLPLKRAWKRARRAAGMPESLPEDPPPTRPPRLVADLHVLIDGAACLPPGATGAYVQIEAGDHKVKSAFMPAPSAVYYEAGRAAQSAWPLLEVAHPLATGGYALPVEPQTFRLPIDENAIGSVSTVVLRVIAFMPSVGEVEVSKVEVPTPGEGGGSSRMRMDTPVRTELQWTAYAQPATKTVADWVPLDADAYGMPPPLVGAWYRPAANSVGWY